MEKLSTNENLSIEHEEIVTIDGKQYRKIPSGYTLRQFYSHETPERGPGPGWDFRYSVLEQHGVSKPNDLPDEPHYNLEPLEKT